MKLGFIGTGAISDACIRGLFASDFAIEQIAISRRSREVSAALAAEFDKVCIFDDTQTLIDQSDVIVLAVRPQVAKEVLAGLKFTANQRVISLIATLTHETMAQWFGADVQICRAIPLPFVAQRLGVTVIYPQQQEAHNIFEAIGTVVVAETEAEFDHYGVSSAFMGVYFEILATLSDWMVGEGVPSESAQRYFAEFFNGLNHTALANVSKPFALQVSELCTLGGLNEQAVGVFKQQGGKQALVDAMESIKLRLSNTK